MTLTDVIDREVAGPEGPLRIAAMYAALPPGIDIDLLIERATPIMPA